MIDGPLCPVALVVKKIWVLVELSLFLCLLIGLQLLQALFEYVLNLMFVCKVGVLLSEDPLCLSLCLDETIPQYVCLFIAPINLDLDECFDLVDQRFQPGRWGRDLERPGILKCLQIAQ